MAHTKKHRPAPVPPGNLPPAGYPGSADEVEAQAHAGGGAPFQDQDAKRRLGDYTTEGEHARQQPTQLNDGQQHSK